MEDYVFHEQQGITADEIIGLMMSCHIFCMVLLAQMQSGKTGTYLKVALDSVNNDHVDHVLIISGSRDTSLRAQTTQDLADAILTYCTEDVGGRKMCDMDLKGKLTEKVKVYWSQDLNKITEIKDKTLIIHDESHSAQSKNNMPYRNFYKKHGLENVLHGDDSQLKERSIWLLNVSATPFSELVCNEKIKQVCLTDDERSIIGDIPLSEKSFIFGNPGRDYKGISHFLENDKIHFESEPIDDESHEHIERILRNPDYNRKYCLVRTARSIKDEDLMRTIAGNTGCEYRRVFATGKDEDPSKALDFLKEEPSTKTLVHICGKARMGQVLDKKYIGMAYEQTKKPNTDTILQSLLGRMCGYYDTLVPDIYVSPKTESSVRVYASAWDQNEIEKFCEVNKAMNLKGGSNKLRMNGKCPDKDGNIWQMTVPIKFNISQIEKNFGDNTPSYKDIENTDLINLFEDHRDLISSNPDENTIIQSLAEKDVGNRNIESTTYTETRNTREKLEKAFQSKTREVDLFSNVITNKHTRDVKPFTVIGDTIVAYLIGFVRYDGPLETPIPEVHKKCNYAISTFETEDGEQIDDINGGQVIPFPFESSTNQQLFCKELKKAIRRTDPTNTSSFIENCQKKIMSMHDKPSRAPKGIALSTDVYNESLINNIVKHVERRCNVRISLHKSRGRQPAGYIRYASISWKF